MEPITMQVIQNSVSNRLSLNEGDSDLIKDLIKGWPLVWLFVPALFHQLDALHWSEIWTDHWTAQRRRFLQLLYNL